jgi:hypothetical protein
MNPVLGRVDLVVEVFSSVIAFLIGFGSLYAYNKTHKTRHAVFGVALLAMATGYGASAILNAFVDFESMTVPLRGYLAFTFVQALFHVISMTAILGGLILLILTNEDVTNLSVAFPLILLAPLGAWVGREFYIAFHALAAVLLVICALHYVRWHRESHSGHSLLVAMAFLAIGVSEAVFILTVFSPVFYLIAHSIRFLAFGTLLITLVSIFRGATVPHRPVARRQ